MRAIFSYILICCNKENENKEIINNDINKKENFNKLKTNKSKITNINSKNTNVDSQKKYSFIISGLSIIDDKKKINKSMNQNIKYENKSENQNIIIPKYQNNENNNSNYNFSYSNYNNINEKNENFQNSIFKRNNSKETLISNILLDNSLTSQNSSSLRNLTEILNESKFKSTNKSLTKIISRQTKPLLFGFSNEKIKNKKKEVKLDFDNIILDEEIDSAPKLILSDSKNSNFFNGKKIKINASGCIEGLRKKRDGITIFGLKQNENEDIINDIIVNLNEENDNLLNKLFAIYYDRKKVHYYIQNLNYNIKNNKFIICIKLYDYYINNDEKCLKYFLLGHTIISIFILDDNSINIKIYNSSNNKKNNEYKYYISDSPISIGRENCLININHNHLSRIHSTLLYDSYKNKWKIIDGDEKGKFSSHGTWIILSDNKFELDYSNNYEVKIGKQFFNIKIQNE